MSMALSAGSLLLEGNWRQDGLPTPDVRTPKDSFQLAFDVFCWKWFLYGMKRGKSRDIPLVQKVVYTFGPYGTTIFIRDIGALTRPAISTGRKSANSIVLVACRGRVKKLSENRKGKAGQIKRLKAANIVAKKMGLRGAKRMDFLKDSAGLNWRTDDAYVRRLLRSGELANSIK